MIKTILIGFAIFALAANAVAQDFAISSISEDFKYATLIDQTTGNEVTIQEGQQLEEKRVVKIGLSSVVLGTVEPDGRVLLQHLNMIPRVMPESWRP